MESSIVAAMIEKDRLANNNENESVIQKSVDDQLEITNDTQILTAAKANEDMTKGDLLDAEISSTDDKNVNEVDNNSSDLKVIQDKENETPSEVVNEISNNEDVIENSSVTRANHDEPVDKSKLEEMNEKQTKQDQSSVEDRRDDSQKVVNDQKKDVKSDYGTTNLRKQEKNSEGGIRNSLIMKTRGNIYYKKKGTFSSWKTLFVVIDESSQQMNFFTSKDDYEKNARCKVAIDLRFVTDIKPRKQPLLQNKYPLKLYRRAGLSTVLLAASNEEDRAKWITTIEEVVKTAIALQNQESVERSSALASNEKKNDSQTEATEEPVEEPDEQIRPKKIVGSGFKIDTKAISNIKLKRTSSENQRFQQETKNSNDLHDPQEKFGISLRRVNTARSSYGRDDRERSPEYEEFKQKYNSLSLSRIGKNAKLPLNDKSVCSQLMDNLSLSDKLALSNATEYITTIKESKESPRIRRRSPSPNIPISKGVETFVKNANEGKSEEEVILVEEKHATINNDTEATAQMEKQIDYEVIDASSDPAVDKEQITTKLIIPEIQLNNRFNADIEEISDNKSIPVMMDGNTITEDPDTPSTSVPNTEEDKPLADELDTVSQNTEKTNSIETIAEETPNDEKKENDPLKTRAIKQFIVRMNSDAHEKGKPKILTEIDKEQTLNDSETNTDSCDELQIVKNGPECPVEINLISEEESRQSFNSFFSQTSTESDEPIPRLNFMGKGSNRSSVNSNAAKETYDNKLDGEETTDNQTIIREKPNLPKRPESSSSVGGRSSLVSPEFTVYEENVDEIEKSNCDSELNREEQIPKKTLNEIEIKNKVDDIVVHIATQQVTESFVEELAIESSVIDNQEFNSQIYDESKLVLNDNAVDFNESSMVRFSDDEFEIIEKEEIENSLPTTEIGEDDNQRGSSNNEIQSDHSTDMETSGIEDLKKYLQDNQMDDCVQVNSDINILGHSAAIEELKSEIPN